MVITKRRLVDLALDVMREKSPTLPSDIGRLHADLLRSIEGPSEQCMRCVIETCLFAGAFFALNGVTRQPAWPDGKPLVF